MSPLEIFIIIFAGILLLDIVLIPGVLVKKKQRAQKEILEAALYYLKSDESILKQFGEYNALITVKSRIALDNYSPNSYFKDNETAFNKIYYVLDRKAQISDKLTNFLTDNLFMNEKEYPYLVKKFTSFIKSSKYFLIKVRYISSAGNNLGEKTIALSKEQVQTIENTPELYMSKSKLRDIEKEKVELRKKELYARVDSIIKKSNDISKVLIVKKNKKVLDDLVDKLYDRTVNSIEKIKSNSSNEWDLITSEINNIEIDINTIILNEQRILKYYESDEFKKVKEACQTLINSQKEFNKYISEKAKAISKLFGTRVTRNETEHEDVYQYTRLYEKTLNPFTAEVSSSVFGSAENNPIGYILKNFYPNKSIYKEQIENLKTLLSELETLKEAQQIIENYKKEYTDYIKDAPSYVIDDDEDGFYERLGFTIIDDSMLNIEYKFVYTSDGRMAQRSFSVPMNEENIAEIINRLETRLSISAQAKEQRAIMTPKLRNHILERDNHTCCICGNSIHNEHNLLLEVDHIIPISKGGLTIESNLQTLCWKCNRKKSDKIIK